MAPKVSVIIPVYNTERYLRQCLDSMVHQTLREIEIICVDDGSTDGSLAILREYEAKDHRIKVLTQPNINAGAARNHGLKHATGEYLSFLDSDDFLETNMLEDCSRKMNDENADIVCFSAKQLDMQTNTITEMPWSLNTRRLPSRDVFSPSEISQYLFNTFQNWPWNKLFRRAFIEQNRIRFQEIARTNDMLFTCLALASAERIAVIDHSYVVYRVGTGTSLQHTNYKCPTAFWEANVATKRALVERGLYTRYEQSLLNWILGSVLYNLRSTAGKPAYAAIYYLIRYCGEQEFQFLSHEKKFYYDKQQIEEYLQIRQNEVLILNDQMVHQGSEDIRSSYSYRIGRVITWFPRKLRGGVHCLQEHGLRFTLHRAGEHLRGR